MKNPNFRSVYRYEKSKISTILVDFTVMKNQKSLKKIKSDFFKNKKQKKILSAKQSAFELKKTAHLAQKFNYGF